MVSYKERDREGTKEIEWRPSKIVILARAWKRTEVYEVYRVERNWDGPDLEAMASIAGGTHRAGFSTSEFTAMSASEAENGSRLIIHMRHLET
jgi:hypothetical protein